MGGTNGEEMLQSFAANPMPVVESSGAAVSQDGDRHADTTAVAQPLLPDSAMRWSKPPVDLKATARDPKTPVSALTSRMLDMLQWLVVYAPKDGSLDGSFVLNGVADGLHAYLRTIANLTPRMNSQNFRQHANLMTAVDKDWISELSGITLAHHNIFIVWRFFVYIGQSTFKHVEPVNDNMSFDLDLEEKIFILVWAMQLTSVTLSARMYQRPRTRCTATEINWTTKCGKQGHPGMEEWRVVHKSEGVEACGAVVWGPEVCCVQMRVTGVRCDVAIPVAVRIDFEAFHSSAARPTQLLRRVVVYPLQSFVS